MTDYIFGIGSGGPTENTGGITKIDITDPTNLTCENGKGLYALLGGCLYGNYIYVGSYYYDRLYIYDVLSTPMVRKGDTTSNTSDPKGIAVKGNYAYVCQSATNCVAVYDVTDKNNIVYSNKLCGAGSPNYLSNCNTIQIIGNYAYVASSASKSITIIDISTPTAISLAGAIVDTTRLNIIHDIYVRESDLYAFTASHTRDGVAIYDVSNPASISFVGEIFGAGSPNYLNGAQGITVDGDYAYVGARLENAMTILNISNPASPSYVSRISGAGAPNYLSAAYGVLKVGDYVYVAATEDHCITSIDVSNPASPTYGSSIFYADACTIGTSNLGAPVSLCGVLSTGAKGASSALPIFAEML